MVNLNALYPLPPVSEIPPLVPRDFVTPYESVLFYPDNAGVIRLQHGGFDVEVHALGPHLSYRSVDSVYRLSVVFLDTGVTRSSPAVSIVERAVTSVLDQLITDRYPATGYKITVIVRSSARAPDAEPTVVTAGTLGLAATAAAATALLLVREGAAVTELIGACTVGVEAGSGSPVAALKAEEAGACAGAALAVVGERTGRVFFSFAVGQGAHYLDLAISGASAYASYIRTVLGPKCEQQ